MKILYYHRTMADGAEGVHIWEMINAFRELGHEVLLVCPRGAGRDVGLRRREERSTSQRISSSSGTAFECAKQSVEIAYNAKAFLDVYNRCKRFAPDFVYERYSSYNAGAVFAARKRGVPTVLEVNGLHSGTCRSHRRLFFPRIGQKCELAAVQAASGIAAVSTPLRDSLVRMGVAPSRVIVTPNAINVATIDAIASDCHRRTIRRTLSINGKCVIGFVGSLCVYHGIDLLMHAMLRLQREEGNIHFLVVGDGVMMPDLRDFVERHCLEECVTLTGGVPHTEALRHISAMDIAVMPHSNEYGSPMKILEYMGMGKPIVAPDIGPICEVLENGVTAVLFRPADPSALVDALQCLIRAPQFAQELGTKARQDAVEKHTWHHNANAVLALSRSVSRIV